MHRSDFEHYPLKFVYGIIPMSAQLDSGLATALFDVRRTVDPCHNVDVH